MKSLKDMVLTFACLGVSRVSLVQSGDKVRVTAVRKHPLTGRIVRRLSKEYPSIQLRGLAAQIAANSHGMYMIGWDTSVEFVNHQVSRIEFRSLGRISARSHSPERKYLLASNS